MIAQHATQVVSGLFGAALSIQIGMGAHLSWIHARERRDYKRKLKECLAQRNQPKRRCVGYNLMTRYEDFVDQQDCNIELATISFYDAPTEAPRVLVEDGPERGKISLFDSLGAAAALSNCRYVYFVDSVESLSVHRERLRPGTFWWRNRQGKSDLIIDAAGRAVQVDDFLRERGAFRGCAA